MGIVLTVWGLAIATGTVFSIRQKRKWKKDMEEIQKMKENTNRMIEETKECLRFQAKKEKELIDKINKEFKEKHPEVWEKFQKGA